MSSRSQLQAAKWRTLKGQSKVQPQKRRRRGVSVFERQLLKRKRWVEGYEERKAQKKRDQRRINRGYYRALRDFHRQRRFHFARHNGKRDVWSELERNALYRVQPTPKRTKHNNHLPLTFKSAHSGTRNGAHSRIYKAQREGQQKRMQRERQRKEKEKAKAKQQRQIVNAMRQRQKRQRIIALKTRKGQPNLNARMGLLLQHIEKQTHMLTQSRS